MPKPYSANLFLAGAVATPKVAIKVVVKADNSQLDLDKLAKAVAMHETANCTRGSAKLNNCHGILSWSGGRRHFKAYPTKEASYEDFKQIWAKYYKVFPTLALARRYSGNDRAHIWLANVIKFYNSEV